jgi:hypothetical protein
MQHFAGSGQSPNRPPSYIYASDFKGKIAEKIIFQVSPTIGIVRPIFGLQHPWKRARWPLEKHRQT